jgi:hypothetical protein
MVKVFFTYKDMKLVGRKKREKEVELEKQVAQKLGITVIQMRSYYKQVKKFQEGLGYVK